jgi:hypothetical protein
LALTKSKSAELISGRLLFLIIFDCIVSLKESNLKKSIEATDAKELLVAPIKKTIKNNRDKILNSTIQVVLYYKIFYINSHRIKQ